MLKTHFMTYLCATYSKKNRKFAHIKLCEVRLRLGIKANKFAHYPLGLLKLCNEHKNI